MRRLIAFVCVLVGAGGLRVDAADAPARPNIVVILADDLGYGDVHCLNPKGKIATPQLDRLAAAGMTFTDAHSGSSVCSPTRYGLLTGRYSWRTVMKSGVLNGYSPRLIEPGRLTIASMLKTKGYRTACFGKWHLGVDWPLKEGGIAHGEGDARKVDYALPFTNGPLTVGFDEYFGISASLDMPPYVFLKNDRAVALPTAEKTWIRTGPADPSFEAIDVLPTLRDQAVAFIERQAAAARSGTPFFLYLPLAAPHTPVVPTKEWQGRSNLHPYADFVMQVDDAIGEVLAALDKNGVANDTLVLVTSDNGSAPAGGFDELKKLGHDASAGFRGHKADIYEGGHRMPFFARWPGHIKAGSTSDQIIGHMDMLATFAELVAFAKPETAGEDSVSYLPALLGQDKGPIREALVNHSANGAFAIRQGRWKLAFCPGSGGWSYPRPGRDDTSKLPRLQLFDLEADRAETTNLEAREPEVVARLTQLMDRYAAEGRSTPGARQPNAGAVNFHFGENGQPNPGAAKKKAAAKKAAPAL